MAQKTKKRINLSVNKEINDALERLAKRDDVPVATKALELVREALSIIEDDVLNEVAEQRDTRNATYVDHEKAWK